jgi:D-alanyl-D-alanine-carboxypeptidase/D-alanyl-D-alanine-endopeptidase
MFMLRIWMLVLSACTSLSLHAAPVAPERIPALLESRHLKDAPGNALVVGIIDAKGRRFYSVGLDDARQPANEHSVFEIGSLTKLFTNLLLADMTVAGEVKLDDPVEAYLPESVKVPSLGGQPIALVDLALHRAGLPRDFVERHKTDPGHADVQSLYRFVTNFTPVRAPGTVEYSNVGVSLLGHALAARAGRSYEQLVAERISRPLGMRDTALTLGPLLRARRAHGYLGKTMAPAIGTMPGYAPSGGLHSTANDMLTFLAAAFNLANSPLQASMATMRRPYGDQPEVRLGWHMLLADGSPFWNHAGRTSGSTSALVFDERAGRGVVVLASTRTEVFDLALHLLDARFPLRQVVPPHAFVRMLEESDFRQVMASYRALRHRDPAFHLEEGPINEYGLGLMLEGRTREAIEVLAFNCAQYPKSANTYDSLAMAYEAHGSRTEAVAAYRKALELDPKFAGAADRIKALTERPEGGAR